MANILAPLLSERVLDRIGLSFLLVESLELPALSLIMHAISSAWLLLAAGLAPLVAGDGCPFAKRAYDADSFPPREIAEDFGRCKVVGNAAGAGTRSRDFWPCQLRLDVLRQFLPQINPLGEDFDYIKAFNTLDCKFAAADWRCKWSNLL